IISLRKQKTWAAVLAFRPLASKTVAGLPAVQQNPGVFDELKRISLARARPVVDGGLRRHRAEHAGCGPESISCSWRNSCSQSFPCAQSLARPGGSERAECCPGSTREPQLLSGDRQSGHAVPQLAGVAIFVGCKLLRGCPSVDR